MSFEETIIHCCAPSLCGIKPACLFSMRTDCFNSGRDKIAEWKLFFSKQKKYFVPLRKEKDRILFFVYDRVLLEKVLSQKSSVSYLKSKGYPVSKGFDACLALLLHRLMFLSDFPHEVGLFLGYPLDDVIGFELQTGSNCIYSGFWKVYSDMDRAVKMMNMYKACSEKCMKLLNRGLSVPLVTYKYISSLEA